MTAAPFKGDLEAFRSRLLARESGIDPGRHDWYVGHLDLPVILMPKVSSPGRLVRSAETGLPVKAMMTVREYFASLGVGEWFRPGERSTLRRMQYASTNALGFIGYQFGEALLTTLGVYEPEQIVVPGEGRCPRLYCGDVPNECWRDGRTEHVYVNPWSGLTTVATDVNRWGGRFTGRCGVSSLDDLRTAAAQESILRVALRTNSGDIQQVLALAQSEEGRALACLRLPASCTDGRMLQGAPSTYFYSGLLAAAHLCGSNAVCELLRTGRDAADEFSTPMAAYVEEFAGYDMAALLNEE